MRSSNCLTAIIVQHPAHPFSILDLIEILAHAVFRADKLIVEVLMISLVANMR